MITHHKQPDYRKADAMTALASEQSVRFVRFTPRHRRAILVVLALSTIAAAMHVTALRAAPSETTLLGAGGVLLPVVVFLALRSTPDEVPHLGGGASTNRLLIGVTTAALILFCAGPSTLAGLGYLPSANAAFAAVVPGLPLVAVVYLLTRRILAPVASLHSKASR